MDARGTSVLRRAAVRAMSAPSVHNTQPWRFHLQKDVLDIYADPGRQLRVLDRVGRQLAISCGCALMIARVSIAASGFGALVDRFPEPTNPELQARIKITSHPTSEMRQLATLDSQVELHETNRRRFADVAVPAEVVVALQAAAATERCELIEIRRPEHRMAADLLSERAEAVVESDPAYRAERRAWTTSDPRRGDGVAAIVADVASGARDDSPLQHVDQLGTNGLFGHASSSGTQCLVLLCTPGDLAGDWLQAGEALERILLEVTRGGFVASQITPVIDVPGTRAELARALGLSMNPQVLLRIGQAQPTPTSRRRRLVDMLVETC